MDYHLQNLQTGERHPLHPERTLIGTAGHATIHTQEGSPFLAALVVQYPAGWVVHALSDDPSVVLNKAPFRVGQQQTFRPNDLLAVGEERLRFVGPHNLPIPPTTTRAAPSCCVYVSDANGVEECRMVDHGLLFGRLPVCHVRFADTRLSRIHALLATHAGGWYIHPLAKGPVGRNRRAVEDFAQLEDGDELQIGPLIVRIELSPVTPEVPVLPARAGMQGPRAEPAWANFSVATAETANTSETPEPEISPVTSSDRNSIHAAGVRLDRWLRTQETNPPTATGLGGWLGAQRDRLQRFWHDTPEATSARSLRTSGQVNRAFSVLDRAIRAHPDSPGLLRELYRLYDSIGLLDLAYRPLRMIEKLSEARGSTDTWALETLARVCESLGRQRPSMSDRAIGYWIKLETVTGVSYAQERAAVMATRALREGGFTKTADDEL